MKYLFLFAFLFLTNYADAQILNKLKKKVEDKVNTAADKIIDGVGNPGTEPSTSTEAGRANRASTVFDFVRGDSVFFRDNFAGSSVGSMPAYWKSSGTGELVEFPGEGGKWLLLTEFTTYKLDTLLHLPQNFTVEFDILTRADKASDLNAFSFGFAKDNSVSGYEDRLMSRTQLHYHNESIISYAQDLNVYNTQDYPFGHYSNAKMRVSIQVEGARMKVYLNRDKVLDTDMLSAGAPKYFYFNPSTRLDNNAQLAVGNFTFAK